MSNRILLVEDDQSFGAVLKDYLTINNFEVTLATDGEMGLKEFTEKEFDICIFDVMMPKKDGFSLAEDVKKIDKNTPIIFLTARNMREDILKGYQLGADDYITKPFDLNVLQARVRVQLRGATDAKSVAKDMLDFGLLKIETNKCRVFIQNEEVTLTSTEFKILLLLAQKPGHVYTREQFINNIQGENIFVTGRTIDTHIAGLRKKLGEASNMIETIRGIGYRFKDVI